MDTKLRNEIEYILKGKATVEQAQKSLSHLTENDLKRLVPQDKLTRLLNEYKRRNNFKHQPLPHVSKREIEEIWQNVISKPAPFYNRIFGWLKEKQTTFRRPIKSEKLVSEPIKINDSKTKVELKDIDKKLKEILEE